MAPIVARELAFRDHTDSIGFFLTLDGVENVLL